MRYLFDKESNSLVVTFAEGRTYGESDEVFDGVVIDYDTDGQPYAIEFLRADRLVDIENLVSGRPVRLAPQPISDTIELDGTAVMRWREQLDLSREELAARLHIPPAVVYAWESGSRPIENPGLVALALQAIEGNAHEEYLRQALRDVTESLQAYLKNEPVPLKLATGGRAK